MKYPSEFISLVNMVSSMTSDNLKFIGQGNLNACILLVGRDCNIDRSSTRGKGCYEMEYLHNVNQWKKNIDNQTDALDIPVSGVLEKISITPCSHTKGNIISRLKEQSPAR